MSPEVDGKIHRPDGANVAFLLIHGFCADIDEMTSLGEALAERGVASFSVRVEGHGTTPEDLATTTSEDWFSSVIDGLNLVKSWKTQYVFVAGLSMGGVLTLLLSTQEEGIDGIVVFSPAIIVGGFAGKLVPLLKIFMKYRNVDLSYIPKMYDLPRTKYDREPLSAIHELLKFVKEARKELPKVTVPTLVIQAGADKTIDPSSGEVVYQAISSTDKEIQVIDNAEHVITCHPTRKDAFPHVFKFIERITGK